LSTTKTFIVPVFIPHQGCALDCIFCNQNTITGNADVPSPAETSSYLEKSLRPDRPHAVIAFYGGSFTCMPREEQDAYLGAAQSFIARGMAAGTRLSTRPDCMDDATASYLKGLGVVTVELGVQSLSDDVLKASGRGHDAECSLSAVAAVRSAGLELGLQFMAGLPGDTPERFIATVNGVIAMKPDFVRIYPTLVVKGAPLEKLWARGGYSPLSLDEAVALCASAVKLLRDAGIKVIRLGLQPSRELEDALLAGPYHPAFGHLVESEIAYGRMAEALTDTNDKGPTHRSAPTNRMERHLFFTVNPSELSVYRGIKSANVERLRSLSGGAEVSILADAGVERGGLTVKVQ